MMGININDKDTNFTEMILERIKTVETRKTASLRPYIGKRVGIIQTGKGKAHLVGYMTIEKEIEYDATGFAMKHRDHRVPTSSAFYKTDCCFGYVIGRDVERCEPIRVRTLGIVARKVIDEVEKPIDFSKYMI